MNEKYEMSAQIIRIVYIRGRNGAPSSKGCVPNDQTPEASKK